MNSAVQRSYLYGEILLYPSTVEKCTAMLAQPAQQNRERNNITTGTEALSNFYIITDPNTAGYSEYIYCQHT